MARRIEQRGVRQLIGDNAILLLRQQMYDRLIGGEAGDKQQRARIAEPVGELRLQLRVAAAIARDVSRRAGTRRVLTPAGDHRRMLAQAEIVVAGEVTVRLSLYLQRAGIVARHQPALPPAVSGAAHLQRLRHTRGEAHYSAAL